MPRKAKEEEQPTTIYDQESEKYPGLNKLKLPKNAMLRLKRASGLLVQTLEDLKPLEKQKKVLTAEIQEILQDQGIDETSFWNILPINIFYGATSKLNVDKLLEAGVSADIISQCTEKKDNSNITVQVLRPRNGGGE